MAGQERLASASANASQASTRGMIVLVRNRSLPDPTRGLTEAPRCIKRLATASPYGHSTAQYFSPAGATAVYASASSVPDSNQRPAGSEPRCSRRCRAPCTAPIRLAPDEDRIDFAGKSAARASSGPDGELLTGISRLERTPYGENRSLRHVGPGPSLARAIASVRPVIAEVSARDEEQASDGTRSEAVPLLHSSEAAAKP
jgi:hypothetical protein